MNKLIDLTGKVFGKWTVIRKVMRTEKGNKRRNYWLCRCSCGREREVLPRSLETGASKSCGCNRRWKITSLETASRHVINEYKNGAKKRNLEWGITDKEFYELTQQKCSYCGIEPSKKQKPDRGSDIFLYNGVDRIDNNLGYTKENSVPCCTTCNLAKRSMSIEEFNLWCERVMKHRMKHVCRSATHFGPLVITSPPISASHFGE